MTFAGFMGIGLKECKLKRIYHHYRNWEEVSAGMWEKLPLDQEKVFLAKAIEFTGNAELYGSYMIKIVDQWPISCEQNLSNTSMNRLAWIGHAACCLAIGCPEYLTRKAWSFLSRKQQDDANDRAREAVDLWVRQFRSYGDQLVFRF